jgi:hypothetical protein
VNVSSHPCGPTNTGGLFLEIVGELKLLQELERTWKARYDTVRTLTASDTDSRSGVTNMLQCYRDVLLTIVAAVDRGLAAAVPKKRDSTEVPVLAETREHLLEQILKEILGVRSVLAERLPASATKSLSRTTLPDQQAPETTLTSKQEEAIQAIEKLNGSSAENRDKAQQILDALVRQEPGPVTKVFTNGLKESLKNKQLGLSCPTCAQAAAPRWQPNAVYDQKGCMQFTHVNPRESTSVSHGGWTQLQIFSVVVRPDRRRKR